jgi:DNA polymerase-3 subunit alpha
LVTPLHIHSEYSLLDGSLSLSKLVKGLKTQGYTSAALTDHDSLHGIIEFSSECQKHGIHPIIGYEANVEWPDLPSAIHPIGHLTLLVETAVGYQNLLKICTYANTTGQSHFSVSQQFLKDHSEGLICLTSCLKSHLSQLVLNEYLKEARTYLKTLETLFPQSLYIEIMDNGIPEQKILQQKLIPLSLELNIPLVATPDTHYLEPSDREAHLSVIAIKHKLSRDHLEKFPDIPFFHLPNPEEMEERFKDIPDSIKNTDIIAARCSFKLPKYLPSMPSFSEDPFQTLKDLTMIGLEKRRPFIESYQKAPGIWDFYLQRLERELQIISQMEFSGYFLIVQDFIQWSKNQGIPVGPGRGSAAGSLVTYALGITDIDPIRFDLLFERFLNPERISLPDIDTDFCQEGRAKVLNYVYEKYGNQCVAQIVTFGRLMARNALKGIARIHGWNFKDSNDFAQLIPQTPGMTLSLALEEEPQLQSLLKKEERAQELWSTALGVEGIVQSLGIHAAGVIISSEPLVERCPLMESEGQILTQFENKYAEKVGLIKFDFLGLKTLTVINHTLKRLPLEEVPCWDSIDIEDPNVYKTLNSQRLTGIFQLESTGMRNLIQNLKPSCFDDIIALLALFRPGPLSSGMVDEFVQRKHGQQAIHYFFPQLEPILKNTYGSIVYQEQVQSIAATLGNFTLGEADLLRRAMGKKDKKEMDNQKKRFLDGCDQNQLDPIKSEEIFDLMAKFAEYGFNKSHSAAYGMITFQTAYLKTYQPIFFMASLMTADRDNTDKIYTYVQECLKLNIPLLPPSINKSHLSFEVENGSLRYALGAIKGLGEGFIQHLVTERSQNGSFKSVTDFLQRIQSKNLNKKILESLIKSGSFDEIPFNHVPESEDFKPSSTHRQTLLKNSESWLKTLQSQTASFFFQPTFTYTPSVPFTFLELSSSEKEVFGFYFMNHPVEEAKSEFALLTSFPLSEAIHHLEPDTVPEFKRKVHRVGGLIKDIQERYTKNKDKFYTLLIEDKNGQLELVVSQKPASLKGDLILVECKLRRGFGESLCRGVVQQLYSMTDARHKYFKALTLESKSLTLTDWDSLEKLLTLHPGDKKLYLSFEFPEEDYGFKGTFHQKISFDQGLFQEIFSHLHQKVTLTWKTQ